MTWQEKRQERFEKWLNPEGIVFAGPEAKAAYQAKVQRMIDAIELKKTPDRIPIYPNYTFFPAYAAGRLPLEVMSDAASAVEVWSGFIKEYAFDAYGPIGLMCPIPVMEALGYQLYSWPGSRGTPRDGIYRYFERDWMEASEYADLAQDPTNFWLRKYIPRFCSNLSGLSSLPVVTEFFELPNLTGFVTPFGLPDVQNALKKLMEAGDLALNWMQTVGQFMGRATSEGHPSSSGGMTKAPFDILSDTLRSMKSAMLDMRRNGEAIIEACERLTPLAAKMGIDSINRSGNPLVFMPLHKGADGFMSQAQFEKFYWPSLKRVMELIIEAGGVPVPFAEGGYSQRIDYLNELPKSAAAWMIDRTDMVELKKKVGGNVCLIGNVPGSLLHSATPADVEKYCRNLIDQVGPGGGFMLATGAVLDEGRPEMVKAMINAVLEFGVY
jgi:hypothetical protein